MGGLGIKSLAILNKALLCKFIFFLPVKSKYYKKEKFNEYTGSGHKEANTQKTRKKTKKLPTPQPCEEI